MSSEGKMEASEGASVFRAHGGGSSSAASPPLSPSSRTATITHPLARAPSPTAPTAAAASSLAASSKRPLHSIDLSHLLSSPAASGSTTPRSSSGVHAPRDAVPQSSARAPHEGGVAQQRAADGSKLDAENSATSDLPSRSASIGGPSSSEALNRPTNATSSASPTRAGVAQSHSGAVAPPQSSANEAMMVRRNMLRASLSTYVQLGKGKRILLVLQFLLSLCQVILGIVVACLPDSLGDSLRAPGSLCDPESMYVFLLLHTFRVLFCIPIDLYLGLSPHRTPAARRNRSAEARAQREANRTFGNLALDAKASRLSDLLGLSHIGIWLYGNYAVWTSLECSHRPADSVVLWWSSLTFLSITYIIILEVALLISLVVFFLPIVLAILRAFGLTDRFPRAGIHPTTSKIDQAVIEKSSTLVYFVPAEEEARTSEEGPVADAAYIGPRAKLDQSDSPTKVETPSVDEVDDAPRTSQHRSGGLARLFTRRKSGRGTANAAVVTTSTEEQTQPAQSDAQASHGGKQKWRYPLHPIPAHRATCPICLLDFVTPEQFSSEARAAASDLSKPVTTPASTKAKGDASRKRRSAWNWRSSSRPLESAEAQAGGEGMHGEDVEASAAAGRSAHAEAPPSADASCQAEAEVLRLMPCGHALHRACVDEWLSSVSGRCPVCQKPLVEEREETDASRAPPGTNGNAENVLRDVVAAASRPDQPSGATGPANSPDAQHRPTPGLAGQNETQDRSATAGSSDVANEGATMHTAQPNEA
ncbi:Predicted E3 ubiquitin ligase [Ceraceosorus bombacis]|uniref:Predicted E3 ubiquitin ligase n=1 Tax=Ceraceosorus bombacis TaxID=401625 RepID=A0A0P1BF95_9BASI|nr:Predicted E3 ubiquitin ligase [Ceraceosorus bombacis]